MPCDLHSSHNVCWLFPRLLHSGLFCSHSSWFHVLFSALYAKIAVLACPMLECLALKALNVHVLWFLYDLLNWQSSAISPLSYSGLSCADGRRSLCAWDSATPANMTALASPVMNCLANMAPEVHLLWCLCYTHSFPGDAPVVPTLPSSADGHHRPGVSSSASCVNIAARIRVLVDSRSASNGTHRWSISHLPWSMTWPMMLVFENMTIRVANRAN